MPRYSYDPRLVKVEDTYYIIWYTDFYGAALSMAKTTDFKILLELKNPFLPFNRNGVLYPRNSMVISYYYPDQVTVDTPPLGMYS